MTTALEAQTHELTLTLAPFELHFTEHPEATLRPEDLALGSSSERALTRLSEIEKAQNEGRAGALVVGRTLGEGGMGVVRLATQVSLGRQVAAKTLHEDERSERAVVRLLREAWVTGSLEHPNVVPVHDLSIGEDGAPSLVLKRIEGARWLELIADPESTRRDYGAADHLEWNLRILIAVIRALELAHSRRIVHRDVKPENVMIGPFGEVYLMDWGLAASLDPDPSGRLPTIQSHESVAGTPAYMAPEMVGGAAGISERTDVYLVGATLYEVLTGQPPHRGETLMQVVGSIMKGEPELPDTVPQALTGLVEKAMARDPDARFRSVSELREALEAFLAHRPSLALSNRAEAILAEIAVRLRAEDPSDEDRARTYELFAECRFAFGQALTTWADNEAAESGLRRATETMIGHELSLGDASAAAKLLAELADPDEEIVQQVEAALAAKKADAHRIAALEALSRDLDPDIGRRARTIAALVLGVAWVIGPIIGGYRTMILGHVQSPRELLMWPTLLALTVGLVGYAGRRALAETAINRRLILGMLFAMSAQAVFHLGMLVAGLTPALCQVMDHFLWFCVSMGLVGYVDRRLWPAAVGYLVGFLVAAADPELRWVVMTVANLMMVLNFVALFARLPARGARAEGRGSTHASASTKELPWPKQAGTGR